MNLASFIVQEMPGSKYNTERSILKMHVAILVITKVILF